MIKTIDNIPVYRALIDQEDEGMIRISLVDSPAVEVDFLYFDKEERPMMFSAIDDEKHIVIGCVMRADYPIYREQNGFPYYIVFDKDTIRQMAQKYLRENRQNAVDLMHDGDEVQGVELVQFFIKDSAAGIAPSGFDHISDGSLFAEFKVESDTIWQAIKEGTFKGFSLEGLFSHKIVKSNKIKKMTKIERIKKVVAEFLAEKMWNVGTNKGVIHWEGDEDLKEGMEVYAINEDGKTIEVEDGDYTTEDGKIIRVVGGKVESIFDPEAEVDEGSAEEPIEEAMAEEDIIVDKPEGDNPEERHNDERIDGIEERLATLEDRIEEMAGIINGLVEAIDKMSIVEPAKKEFAKMDDDKFARARAISEGLRR